MFDPRYPEIEWFYQAYAFHPLVVTPRQVWGLLLSLIELAYSIGKNSVTLSKENENNTAEIYNETSDRGYFGGSPQSLVAALLIAILNYKLQIYYN